ncbi:Gfo/Idh/MocA family protein [Infirmifilum sp. SLHALR2]
MSVAIVGFGKMGLLHSTILNMLVDGIVKYVVDRSFVVRFGFSRLFKKSIFKKNLDEVLDSSVDMVYITTPTYSHYPMLRNVLSRGVRAIFVEKPPTASYEQLRSLVDLARGRITMAGFQKRFALPFRHARLLIESGLLGSVESIEAYIRSGDITEPTERFRGLGRGVLLDLGLHLVDLLAWFFKDLRVEKASCRSIFSGVDDYCELLLGSREGFEVGATVTWSDPSLRVPETLIRVKGSKGLLEVSEDYLRISTASNEKTFYRPHYYQGIPPVLVADPEYTIENMHLLLSLAENRDTGVNLDSALPAMRIIDEAYALQGSSHG